MTVTESIETRLAYHLTANFYPPIRAQVLPKLIPTAVKAINRVAGGKPQRVFRFPNGTKRTAAEIVEDLRLDYFVDELRTIARAPDDEGDER